MMVEELVARDTPVLANYLTEINAKLDKLTNHVKLLQETFLSGLDLQFEVDLLQLKNHLLLRYTQPLYGNIVVNITLHAKLC